MIISCLWSFMLWSKWFCCMYNMVSFILYYIFDLNICHIGFQVCTCACAHTHTQTWGQFGHFLPCRLTLLYLHLNHASSSVYWPSSTVLFHWCPFIQFDSGNDSGYLINVWHHFLSSALVKWFINFTYFCIWFNIWQKIVKNLQY